MWFLLLFSLVLLILLNIQVTLSCLSLFLSHFIPLPSPSVVKAPQLYIWVDIKILFLSTLSYEMLHC